jgi:hypothetical protein
MTDAESIQLLASLNSRALRTIENLSSSGPQHHPQFRPPQQHQLPQQDYQVPQIPDYLPTDVPSNLVEMPRDAKGNVIIPPEYRHLIPNQSQSNQPQPATPVNYSNASFDMPNYSAAIPDESKFDIIIKEIKSLKKAINKLIKLNETVKLSEDKPSTNVVNDTEIKPS